MRARSPERAPRPPPRRGVRVRRAAPLRSTDSDPQRMATQDPDTPPSSLPFSPATRALHWDALDEETFDLLVVGGGITGVATAHDAACRGLRVALVEAGDFARGTSSRSSRLVHGGLRYLETFDFGLVSEALGERRRLFDLAPHLVHPSPSSSPSTAATRWAPSSCGRGCGSTTSSPSSATSSCTGCCGRAAALRQEPELRREAAAGGRPLLRRAGGRRPPHAGRRARGARGGSPRRLRTRRWWGSPRDGRARWRGRGCGTASPGRGEKEVRARVVLSATGPWTDELRRLADPAAAPRLRPTKGVHILLRRSRVGNRAAIIFRSAVDGRVMFVLPWGDSPTWGRPTPDLDSLPDEPHASAEDVDYLLESANALLPGRAAHPGRRDQHLGRGAPAPGAREGRSASPPARPRASTTSGGTRAASSASPEGSSPPTG